MKRQVLTFVLVFILLSSPISSFPLVLADSAVEDDSEKSQSFSTISVLVIYPDEGEEELRSYAEDESLSGQNTISGYVSEVFNSTNQNYARSGIDVSFDLIETMQINLSNIGIDWKSNIPGAMMNPGSSYSSWDLYRDELNALRDITSADVVVYWRISGDGGPGASGATPFDSEHANQTFVHLIKWHMNPRVVSHELGHLLGGEHHVGLQDVANMSYDGGPFEMREIRSIETSQVSSLGYGSALYLWVFSDANATFSGTIPCGYSSEHNCTFAEPTVVGNENQSNVDQMLRGPSIADHRDGSEYPSRSNETISGEARIEIYDLLEPSSNISASWTAHIVIHDEYGIDLLPNQDLGLRQQIDQHLGDGNGWISLSEVANLSALIVSARNWNDSSIGGCCSLDNTAFEAIDGNQISTFAAVGPVGRQMIWGWTEHSDLSGQTDSGSIRLLTIPRVGNMIEEVPLTIVLPEPFQFGFSPMLEIISGSPSEFTVNRSSAPVASDIRISIRENMPPTIVANRFNQGSQVSLNNPTTYEAQCFDSELENFETEWKVSNNGSEVLSHTNEPWISITPSELGFSHGEVLSVVFSCTDSFDETETWYENIVIDGIFPTWVASFTAIPTDSSSREIDVSDGIIEIGSEEILEINITALDDSGNVNTIEITSNKTSEWRHVDWDEMVAQSTFSQDKNVNGIHLDIESRHQEKEESRFSLNLSVTDDAGNPVYNNWTILVVDQAGPQILPEIYSNGSMIELESLVRVNETLTVNLSNSFDDLDSISDTIWTIIIDEETIFDNQSFEEVENFDYTPQKAGDHWFLIIASDSKQNVNSLSFPISIQPSHLVDIHFWNLSHYGSSIVGDTILFHAVFQNFGGDAAMGRLCSQEVCSEYVNIPPATSQYPIVEFGVDLDLLIEKSGYVDLYFEWTGIESDQKGEISIDHEIYANPDSGPLQTTILVFAIIAVFSWLAHRLWGTERLEE